jgi:ABC-type phosphate transport system substrate-binding protein
MPAKLARPAPIRERGRETRCTAEEYYMRAIHKIAVVGATLATVVGVGLGTASTALADPASTPSLTTLVGVGSDTITPLFAGSPTENSTGSLVTDYNATSPTYGIASWDAVDPSTGAANGSITAKASGSTDTSCKITRPDGSSAGIAELNVANLNDSTEADINGTEEEAPCVDYARSSRPANSTTFDDTFVAQAKDAIAWGYPSLSGETNPQPASLTQAELVDIYTCVDYNWSQVGGTSAPIVAVIPQAGSGTRATFLGDLGITASSEPCWVNGVDPLNSANVIEENTGLSAGNQDMFDTSADSFTAYNGANATDPTTANSEDVIYPYSIGDWIAQGSAVTGTGTHGTAGAATVGGHASSIWGHGDITLADTVNPATGDAEAPTSTNVDHQPVINPSFSSQFQRTLYVVVRNGFSDPTSSSNASWPTLAWESAGLQAAFGPTGFTCKNATAQSDEVSYGFGLLGANCGALTAGD